MVDVTPLIKANASVIQGYGQGQFRISGQVYDGTILVTESDVITIADGQNPQDVILNAHQSQGGFDVVLYGSGAKMTLPPKELVQALRSHEIVVEPMDSAAACRTYNVLMAEGRRVAALLMPIS